IASFVLSLFTGAAFKLMSVYVQSSLTNLRSYSYKLDLDTVTLTRIDAAEVFSKTQVQAIGGIAEGLATKSIPVPAALKFPTPKQATYQLDSWSGVESLRGDFDKIVAGSAAIVLGQFRAAQTWMNEDTEFGEAWLNYSLDSGERARNEIRLHIEKQR